MSHETLQTNSIFNKFIILYDKLNKFRNQEVNENLILN